LLEAVYQRLTEIVGSEWVSVEPEVLVAYSRDLATYPIYHEPKYADGVVLPKDREQVRAIILLAQEFKIPITIRSTGLSMVSMQIPVYGGILLDLRRMNRILEINENLLTATVEPGVSFARLSCELQKHGMFIAIPGAPSSAGVLSNYVFAGTNKANNRLGWQYRNIVGIEIVLPNGAVLRTGSAACSDSNDFSFWSHGPGPDLYLVGTHAMGALGVVTKMTVKCHFLDDQCKIFWGSFEDVHGACRAYIEVMRRELCTGSCLYGGHKYHSYATDTAEAQYRMDRVHPDFALVLTFQGSQRRVEYEEKIVRDVVRKNGGRIITDRFPAYQAFVDSHIPMATSLYSDPIGAIRYWGSRGINTGALMLDLSIDQVSLAWRIFVKCVMQDPYFSNPNKGNGDFGLGIITYGTEGGHFDFIELGLEGHPLNIESSFAGLRVTQKCLEEFRNCGIAPNPRRHRPPLPGSFEVQNAYMKLVKEVKKRFDPERVMSPGSWFPRG
jgi:FAD/FMN-containing dehydrogenase